MNVNIKFITNHWPGSPGSLPVEEQNNLTGVYW